MRARHIIGGYDNNNDKNKYVDGEVLIFVRNKSIK